MLKIRKELIDRVKQAQSPLDLHEPMQGAVELEHSTIPPYLIALYSIAPGTNDDVAALIRSIVRDEMLHMAIAANILNAVGGHPVLNGPTFIPQYPAPLPMNIHGSLTVGLAPLSKPLIRDVFMQIEMPEDPQHYPVKPLALVPVNYGTIGEFYGAIMNKIQELGDAAIVGDAKLQLTDSGWFGNDKLFAIHDAKSAVRGLQLIVKQGEGTKENPLQADGKPAHYYRFAEIIFGRELVEDSHAVEKYSFSGAPIHFDETAVRDLITNPKLANYAPGKQAYNYARRFNSIYTNLLNSLHLTFNGQTQHFDSAVGGMYELRLAAEAMLQLRDESSGKLATPTFEYDQAS